MFAKSIVTCYVPPPNTLTPQIEKKKDSLDTKVLTLTGLRVACLLRRAYTSFAAISRLGIGTRSSLNPTTTRFRASVEGGEATIHRN